MKGFIEALRQIFIPDEKRKKTFMKERLIFIIIILIVRFTPLAKFGLRK